jgi:hypothetical protein
MLRQRPRRPTPLGIALAALLGLCGCSAAPAPPEPTAQESAAAQRLGLMTSLPLYWPLGAGLDELASGRAAIPWQRAALSADYRVEPLDTLSPIPGLAPDAPATDPLAGLERLAVIQPRGLSPADNVALDDWVRSGGRLLLVLDPMLTGDYDLALGDPRRPVDTALIPPVVAHWGLAVRFDETQAVGVTTERLGAAALPLALAGQIAIADAAADCTLLAERAAARCRVGAGQVMLIADAALFEHAELASERGAGLLAVLAAALE